MQNLIDELKAILAENPKFAIDGKLQKDLVVEAALALNPELLSLLIKNEKLKKHFFNEVEKTLVFDKVKFQTFILNKNFLPDSFTKFKIKIGLATEDKYISEDNRVILNWPYKDCILEGGQKTEDAKRQEIFWNKNISPDEITRLLKPKALGNFDFYGDKFKDSKKSFDKDNNLIIKGNNLLAMETIKPVYANKIDVIYIDPPYYFDQNKASDTFSYNSNFKLSTWLTFMSNRLEIAKTLLSKKGIIFISISDDGIHYLRLLCEEIFGKDLYITTFIWKKRAGGGNDSEGVAMDHEYVLCFGNISALKKLDFNEEQLKRYKFQDSKFETHGPYSLKNLHDSSLQDSPGLHHDIECPDGSILLGRDYQWKCNKETYEERLNDDRIVFTKDSKGKWRVEYKIYLYENRGKLIYDENNQLVHKGVVPNAMLEGIASNSDGTKDLKALFPEAKKIFSYPKPVKLIKHLLRIVENRNATVLDFFAGSGTTAHAVMDINNEDGGNRRFILIEQMDYIKPVTTERVIRAIAKYSYDTSFIYTELIELNENFTKQILAADTILDLEKLWNEIKGSKNLNYKYAKIMDKLDEELNKQPIDVLKNLLLDLIDLNSLYLPLTEIEDKTFEVSPETIALNKSFFGEDLDV